MSHRFVRLLDLPNEFIIGYLRDIHRSTHNRNDFEEALQNMMSMPIALRGLLVDRYSENDFQLEEQELNDLRVSLEDVEHLFEETISTKLDVFKLLCKMEGSCSICLKKYKEGQEVGILHCSHEFHADCIKHWLSCKNVCPLCKAIGIPI
ncbi:E3 ubiquitin protein ligase RING1 [Tanacetum coccineum]